MWTAHLFAWLLGLYHVSGFAAAAAVTASNIWADPSTHLTLLPKWRNESMAHTHTLTTSPERTSILHHSFASAVNESTTLFVIFIVWIFINYEKACQNISDLKNILSLRGDSWTELRYWKETRNCLACNFSLLKKTSSLCAENSQCKMHVSYRCWSLSLYNFFFSPRNNRRGRHR